MKKLFVLVLAAAAFIFSGFAANAQYRPGALSQCRAGLEDENGRILSDQEVFQLIGEEVYNQTYTGACKQYKTGKTLIIVGAVGAGIGTVGTIAGAAAMAYAIEKGHVTIEEKNGKKVITAMDDKAKLASLGYITGAVLLGAGVTCLSVGIPLKVIGTKRLDWIAKEYNHSNYTANFQVGLTQSGAGLVLNF